MTGYTSFRSNPSLAGSEYDKVASIMKALGTSNPNEFVGIMRHLYWEDESIDGRRLGIFTKIKSWGKCAVAVALASGYCATHFSCIGPTYDGSGTSNYMDDLTHRDC